MISSKNSSPNFNIQIGKESEDKQTLKNYSTNTDLYDTPKYETNLTSENCDTGLSSLKNQQIKKSCS